MEEAAVLSRFSDTVNALVDAGPIIALETSAPILADLTIAKARVRKAKLTIKQFERNVQINVNPVGKNSEERKAYMERMLYGEKDPSNQQPVYHNLQQELQEAEEMLDLNENLWRLVRVATGIQEPYESNA